MVIGNQSTGGWASAFSNQRNKLSGLDSKNQTLFTLFIDNLPEGVDQSWLRKTFNNYGVVKDAFIPYKRSKRTGSKFGFVRYDCHVSAGVAISKSNGLWVSDKKLYVKEASFGQYMINSALKVPIFNRPAVETSLQGSHGNQGTLFDIRKNGHKSFNQGTSYAQMVTSEINKGSSVEKEAQKGLNSSDQMYRRISLNPEGNGWLYRSAVAKLHKLISISDLKAQMADMGLDNVVIKALGGRSVILTCSTKEEMEKMIEEKCLQRWFSDSKPWDGQAACVERFVWLCCYGMPLNGWSNNSFKSIGELWGSFISTDESTMKMTSFAEAKILIATNIFKEIDEWITVEVGEKCYKVKVMEDSCDQPHEAEKQIPSRSLHSTSHSEDESKEEDEESDESDQDKDEDGEMDTPVVESDTNGTPSVAELIVGHGSESFCDLASGGANSKAKESNLEGDNQLVAFSVPIEAETNNNDSSQPLADGIIMEREKFPCLHEGPLDIGTVTERVEIDDGFYNLSEVGFLNDKEVEGIQLVVDLNPNEVIMDTEHFGDDLVSIESRGTLVPSHEVSGSLVEQYSIEKELQETIITGSKLGIKFDDAGVLRMKEMIEQEAKDMEFIMKNNSFAPLRRNKLQKNGAGFGRGRQRSH